MRKKEGNKETDILSAAIQIFAKDGYHKAKIHNIADLAKVATGSVYVYYKNKETILKKVFDELWEKLYIETERVEKNPNITIVEKFDSMIDVLFDMFIENPSLAMVFVNEQYYLMQKSPEDFTEYYDKFQKVAERIVKAGIKSQIFNSSIDVKILRSFVFGGIRNLLHQWVQDPKTYSLRSIRQNVKFFTKNGLLK